MKLIVHEIVDSVFQTFIPSKNTQVLAIRPHLYIHNNPTGSLKVQVCASDGTLIAESEPITISSMKTLSEYHGYITFYVSANLKAGVEYRVYVVSGDGYSFSESAYCAVCSDFDLRKYSSVSVNPHPWISPLDFEVWSLSNK